MDQSSTTNQAELEAFRQQWVEEVSARNRQQASGQNTTTSPRRESKAQRTRPAAASFSKTRRKEADYSEELEPRAYHDLPDKEEYLKLGTEGQNHDRQALFKEPVSALEHYELAVEREAQGNFSESMKHYYIADKLDKGVHEAYKQKHFPPSSFVKNKTTTAKPAQPPPVQPGPSKEPAAKHSAPEQHHSNAAGLSDTLKQLIGEFSSLRIEPPEPPTDASPPERCAIAELPDEILCDILTMVAVEDPAAFMRMAQVCKRLAYLVLTEESIWKRVSLGPEFGMAAMHYEFACDLNGNPLERDAPALKLSAEGDSDSDDDFVAVPESPATALLSQAERRLHAHYDSSWRQHFRARPRIRFGGCYISTVNYTRAGASSTNTLSWGAPVHVVTYFRYLRFFRDGSVISLLTTARPEDVVHQLTRANLRGRHHHHPGSLLPSAVMKDALPGRWRLSAEHEEGGEGLLHIETQGVVEKYTYKMVLALAHAGRRTRNNKLAWKRFWSYNKLTDDEGEFGLRNDREKGYYWSRVKSYGVQGE